MPLDSLDASILGQLIKQVDGQSKFFQEMQAASKKNTDIEFGAVDPPDLAETGWTLRFGCVRLGRSSVFERITIVKRVIDRFVKKEGKAICLLYS
jgi:hypothetical protein